MVLGDVSGCIEHICDNAYKNIDVRHVQRTSDLVREAIAHVRDSYPYWNASGGADHFMVFSYDHGKCEMAKALQFEEFGKIFSVQAYGSLVYRCVPSLNVHASLILRPG